jgi:hypothetical protein
MEDPHLNFHGLRDNLPAQPGAAGRGSSVDARWAAGGGRLASRRFTRCPDLRYAGSDRVRDVLGIASDTVDLAGRRSIEELQADEVQPRLLGDDPPLVEWLGVTVKDREIDPREVWTETGAPDDVGGSSTQVGYTRSCT